MKKKIQILLLIIIIIILIVPQLIITFEKFKLNIIKNNAIRIAKIADEYFMREQKLEHIYPLEKIECSKIPKLNVSNKNCKVKYGNGMSIVFLENDRKYSCIGTRDDMICIQKNNIKGKNAVDTIISLCTDSCKDGIPNSLGLYKDMYGNYRYSGLNPANYVKFNGETWRIIGVFDGRIKIIRNDSLGDFVFDDTHPYSNEWAISNISKKLNMDYLINTVGNGLHLNSDAQSLIGYEIWYTSGIDSVQDSIEKIYESEHENKYARWIGEIGLMYISDYLYAGSNCYNDGYSCKEDNWLYNEKYQWVISPYLSHFGFTWYIDPHGFISSNYGVDNSFSVRPTLYLLPDVHVMGSGTVTSPFQFNI